MSITGLCHQWGRFSGRRFALAAGVAVIALPTLAHADDMQTKIDGLQRQIDALKAAPASASTDSATSVKKYMAGDSDLSWNGITLYGTVDIGVAYQTHGAPLNDYFPTGLEYLVQKNSNKSITSAAPNGLSQSKIGVKVEEPIGGDFMAIGKLETGFNPTSGDLTDGPKSMTQNNGVALAQQSSNGDSSRAGQPFQGAAYLGVSSPKWGTLTFGRQNGVMLDDVVAYDPMGGSYAFSIIGYSGATAGIGDTQDARLDSSMKYANKVGPVRFAAQIALPGNSETQGISAEEFDLGTDYAGFSVDGVVSHVKDAISVSTLTTAQVATLGGIGNTATTLNATASDNTGLALMAKYGLGPVTTYAGYEHILYANPASPVSNGASDIGGYTLNSVTNNAYTTNKILQVAWAGVKYQFTPALSTTGAYYHYSQNSYYSGAAAGGAYAGCHNDLSSKCSGSENAVSLMVDYKFTKRFDVYGGAMWSQVIGGMNNGYLNNNSIDPMIGGRFNF